MSLPGKQQNISPLTHDMMARYMRHCPLGEAFSESKGSSDSPLAPVVDSKGTPRLVRRDFDVLDILCTADTAGDSLMHCCALRVCLVYPTKSSVNSVHASYLEV
jgi:hypothetical protein